MEIYKMENTIKAMNTALLTAGLQTQKHYNANNGIVTVGDNVTITQTDILGGLSLWAKASTEAKSRFCELATLDFLKGITACPVKKYKRAIQSLLFASTGDAKYLKASTRTAVKAVCLMLAGADGGNRVQMMDLQRGHRFNSGEMVWDKAQTAKRICSICGWVKPNTTATQLSVSLGGDAPILLTLGIVTQNGAINRASKTLHAIMKHLNRLTDEDVRKALMFTK